MLADKISGILVGLWLLLPEHLRLGTWDLLTAWAGSSAANAIKPRLALQMVHESALCLNGVRHKKALRQKGFETLNLHIRFAKLTLALIAQAAIYELRQKLPGDIKNWTAVSMARKLFNGIDGDLRVKDDTIIMKIAALAGLRRTGYGGGKRTSRLYRLRSKNLVTFKSVYIV